jgi:uncharacterized protein (TIGR01777 family)
MRVMIAGGRGFLGGALKRALLASGHEVQVLTRSRTVGQDEIHWSGAFPGDWTAALHGVDAVVNACGYGLEHWPWTNATKRRFFTSRVEPGSALAEAIADQKCRPSVFIQFSGINLYGLQGTKAADESTPAADDFLARLTVEWEDATKPLEEAGVRRVVVRNAIVLDARKGLFPLMSLPAKFFVGGPLGAGSQTVPWIHLVDHVRAVSRLLEDDHASGAYNLVAPTPTTNVDFMEAICRAFHRPYWLPVPAVALRLVLGEMSVLVLDGRISSPRRLLEQGFEFAFPTLEMALKDLLGGREAGAPVGDTLDV